MASIVISIDSIYHRNHGTAVYTAVLFWGGYVWQGRGGAQNLPKGRRFHGQEILAHEIPPKENAFFL